MGFIVRNVGDTPVLVVLRFRGRSKVDKLLPAGHVVTADAVELGPEVEVVKRTGARLDVAGVQQARDKVQGPEAE